MPMIDKRRFLVIAAAAATSACATTPAADTDGPWRTTSEGADARLMLEGHDAVAYFTQGKAVRGDPAIKLEHKGVTWRFASDANRAEFQRSPDRYLPQNGGWCSNGINYAIPWGGGGGENSWRIYRGKLYVFGGQKARDHFEMQTQTNIDRAQRYWRDEVAGSNPIVTRYKRLILRVPHYKSDAALQSEWEALEAAGKLPVMPGAAQVVPAAP
jgi:YHS domain-containing protein